jgi:hypothetical protein
MQGLLQLALAVLTLVAALSDAEKKAQMDDQMKAIQKFLMEAESDGKADKPMMIKNVNGKMVMEPIPEDVMKNFVFPDQLDKDDI